MKPFEFKNFDYSEWNRPAHTVIRDTEIKSNLFEKGFHILPSFINKGEIEKLKNNYIENLIFKRSQKLNNFINQLPNF